MIPIPILKVLSSFQKTSVQALLMGGQACVFYGAAEFSRDTDFAILASEANLIALKEALEDLQAEVIALPSFDIDYLQRGHAVHFRCKRADVHDMRVDVMARMRGVDAFPALWERRTSVAGACQEFSIMSLRDLVQAKKTQRDKDWPMIRRLVDRHYFANRENPAAEMPEFWLRELRSAELLVELARHAPEVCERILPARPFLAAAGTGDVESVEKGLAEEEARERAADRAYWKPLKEELQALRRQRRC